MGRRDVRPHPYARRPAPRRADGIGKDRDGRRGREQRHSVSSSCSASDSDDGSGDEGHIPKTMRQIAGRYTVLDQLGKGTFGRVFLAMDEKRNRKVALKVVRRVPRYCEDALVEASILWDLQEDPESKHYVAQVLRQFEFDGHLCLSFEMLGLSLRQFIRLQRKRGQISMERLRAITKGLVAALEFIHDKGLTHADLKTDNVLFQTKESAFGPPVDIVVKLIDFGAATWKHDKHASIIQTRHYRAPEVILDLGWNEAADMWSVGCIVLELLEGKLTFDTHDSLEHLTMMQRFVSAPIPENLTWRAGHDARDMIDARGVLRSRDLKSSAVRRVDAVQRLRERIKPVTVHHEALEELLHGLFQIDPAQRMSARDALRSRFLSWWDSVDGHSAVPTEPGASMQRNVGHNDHYGHSYGAGSGHIAGHDRGQGFAGAGAGAGAGASAGAPRYGDSRDYDFNSGHGGAGAKTDGGWGNVGTIMSYGPHYDDHHRGRYAGGGGAGGGVGVGVGVGAGSSGGNGGGGDGVGPLRTQKRHTMPGNGGHR